MAWIERQTRSVPGQIKGPAPVPHQVREVTLRVEAMPDGRFRVSMSQARGWAMVVRNQAELNRAVTQAFTEAQCAAYATWRGERYDLDDLTEPLPDDRMAPPRARQRKPRNTAEEGWGRNQRRPDVRPPEEWVKLPDGRWQSPGGRTYRADTSQVRRVIARRIQEGLPI